MVAPDASALVIIWSICARLSQVMASNISTALEVSHIGFGENSVNFAWGQSITKNVSLMAIQAAPSPVNAGLSENPMALKKATDFDNSATGRVMNTCLFI